MNDRNTDKQILLETKKRQVNTIPFQDFHDFVTNIKPRFSKPLTTEYLDNMKLCVVECDTKESKRQWDVIHQFQSLHDGVRLCGRYMRFLVFNQTDNTLLGLIRFNLFVPRVKLVDDMIGWTKKDKFEKRMSQYVVNLQCLVPTQPFGYNCLGGKLLTLISASEEIQNLWKKKYGQVYCLTTMSLTAGVCQYTGLKNFSHVGDIVGSHSKITRGIYWCNLYDNSLSLLRRETKNLNGQLKTLQSITDDWKVIARKRITNLTEQNRLSTEPNTYDGLYNHA
jgi:Domain of unknown function (DUF4338)